MTDLQKLVFSKLQEALKQQQLSKADIGNIKSKIGNDLVQALKIIFSFYDDMNCFNESMIEQLIKQKHEAKLREIVLLDKLSSMLNSHKNNQHKGRDADINLQDQQIFQVVSSKIEEISKIIDDQNDLMPIQVNSEQIKSYEDQLSKNKEQILQLKDDLIRVNTQNDRLNQQIIKGYRESQQQQKIAMRTEMQDILSRISQQQKSNISKLYQQQRQKTYRNQEALNNLTKYICQLMRSDEIYQPEDDFNKWMDILKARVETYRRQIQTLTGKKNSWQEKNSLKQILYHQTSKLINRNYRLSEFKGK